MNGTRRSALLGTAVLVVSLGVPASVGAASASTAGGCAPKVIDLGTLGGPNSEVDGGNRIGDLVGAADTADGHTHAVAWFGGRITDLGVDGWAGDVNASGAVVGNADAGAFTWYRGSLRLLPMPAWAVGSYVRRVNERGDASGALFAADGSSVAVVWRGLTRPHVLPLPGGFTSSEGLGINDAGDVVGDVSNDSEQVAWEWDHAGASHALQPEYPGGFSEANLVNDRGWAAGGLDFGGLLGLWSAVWHKGTVEKLNDRVDPDYSFAFGGDQIGDYVGAGVYTADDQRVHVFLTRVGLGRTYTLLPLSGDLSDGSNAHAVVPPHGAIPGTTVGGESPDAAGDVRATEWTCAWQQAIVPPGTSTTATASTAMKPQRVHGLLVQAFGRGTDGVAARRTLRLAAG